MKRIPLLTLLIFLSCAAAGQKKETIQYFPLQSVRLSEGPFKRAQDNNVRYLLEMDADRLLAPFLREAGLTPKADSYTNWENSGLDGHIGGHYLSGLALMAASTGEPRIIERLEYVISEFKRVQEANGNGYIGGIPNSETLWREIAGGNIRASGFGLNDRWVPLYNIHKTYAGLRDAWIHTGNPVAKEMLVALADWMAGVVENLSDEQMQEMLRSEHGGLNETFADVYGLTGDEKYLALAHRFSHHAILDPLLEGRDELTGKHANTQIPKVLGYKRVADLEGNGAWDRAVRFFWETVTDHRSVCIGGNSVSEHFNATDDFSRMISHIEGPETCNTYNMLRLTRMLYQSDPDGRYMDYYERALYNHILSTQHPEQGGFVYFTQMRPGHYRVYSQPHTSMWCCVGSGLENHSKYGETIYAHSDHALYVNLFIASTVEWREKGVSLSQQTNFPDQPRTTLTITAPKKSRFTVAIRVPEWAEGMTVRVNGILSDVSAAGDYIRLNRKWKSGDRIEVELSMRLHAEQLPDRSNYYAFRYGPVVLAADVGREDLRGLFADDSRGGHVAHGRQLPLREMPVLVSEPDKILDNLTPVPGKPLTFKLNNLHPSGTGAGLELTPFYRLHENRYIIYWPQATSSELSEMLLRREEAEREQSRLNDRTIDWVVCGQQQPESDHFIQSEGSATGFTEDNHWRDARGFFSYRMRNSDRKASYLLLCYYNFDGGRSFSVYVNDVLVKEFRLDGKSGIQIVSEVLPIPESETGKPELEVKFAAHSPARTAKTIEVRLLGNEK